MRVRACVIPCVRGSVSAQTLLCAFARVALLIQHATRMRHIACDIFGFAIFFDIVSSTERFSEKRY
jgi:hypothetical protein